MVARMAYVIWSEERLWIVSVIQRVHLSILFNIVDIDEIKEK
jgi:hypothetical protein